MFHRDLGLMDMDLYDYEAVFGTEFPMSKATRLEYGDSQMTHAMLFTGVDLVSGNQEDGVLKIAGEFKVEIKVII